MTDRQRGWIGLSLLSAFLGISAVVGGTGLLHGWIDPGPDPIAGSVFDSYVIPGWVLLAVGILASWGATAIQIQVKTGLEAAALSGLAIIVYLAVEYVVIGFHWLQAVYILNGIAIVLLAMALYVPASRTSHRSHDRGHGAHQVAHHG